MNEEAVRFGAGERLAAILARGRPGCAPRVAVVFITAGLLHKPGPYRLYTQLARALSRKGYPSLRFDISGIGESSRAPDALDAEEAALRDVQEAMDFLQARKVADSFVLAGLCSGAEVAHKVAVMDSRVSGIVAFDGFILRNWKYFLWHYLPRLVSAKKWVDFLRNRLSRERPQDEPSNGEPDSAAFWSDAPPPLSALEDDFRVLVARDVQQLQMFSGGAGDCSYAGQFRDVFGSVDFGTTLDVQFNRYADHMYLLETDRRQLVRAVTRWIQRRFPAMEPSPARAPERRATHRPRTAIGRPQGLPGRRISE